MNSISCEIIQDLLPLYCDDACSEDSKKMIHAHIRTCDKCKEDLRVMGLPLPIPEQKMQIETATAASKMWKKNKRKSFWTGIILTVFVWIIGMILYLGEHYMQTAAIDDVLGMGQWIDEFVEVNHINVKNMVQKGDCLAVSGCDENGLWYVEIFSRDMIFRSRWKALGGLHKVKPGKLASWNYKTLENDTIFVCFGEELSDKIIGYMFENDGITYSCPVEENSVLDFFFISDTIDSRTILEPVYE